MNVHVSEPLIIDLFAGGGGASTGIEMALGRSPDVAINHDPVAIAMHQVNHPNTLHFCNDIWAVDPLDVLPGRPVGLLWASPDCKHFSKAKGGKPKDRNIRDLAWVVVDWAEKRQPDVIGIENVEEFQTWGPLDNEGRPIPEFAGQTFEDWLARLRKAGYRVEWRESRASSYGAPTIRKRLIILATRIGKPRWPKPTHGDPKAKAFDGRRMQPWKTAAEDVIDWSLPCPSIFDDKATIWARYGLRAVRPLAHNTGARVATGIRRYVLDAQEPFIIDVAHASASPDGKVKRWGDGVATADKPMGSVTAGGISQAVVAPHLMTMRNAGKPFNEADKPTHTVTAGGAGLSLVAPVLTHAQQGGRNRRADEPAHTICASSKDQNQVIAAFVAQHNNDSRRVGGVNPGREADKPLSTITVSGAQQGVVAAHVMRQFGASVGHAADEPTGAITAGVNKTGVVAAHMMTMKGSDRRASAADAPVRGVCAGGTHEAIVSGALVKYYGTGDGQTLDEALHTVTVKDRFGFAEAALAAPPFGPEHEARAREVAEFMRAHGQWNGGEFVTLDIHGVTFIIVDIGLRMLTPRELFNAQGFPPDYEIERDADGNVFSKSSQVGRAGNSVSPPWAAAHIAANCGHLMRAPVAETTMEAAE